MANHLDGWKFGLDDNTIEFIGHAIALHTNDQHLHQPALDTVMRMKVNFFCQTCFNISEADIFALIGLASSMRNLLHVSKEALHIFILSMGWENCLRFFYHSNLCLGCLNLLQF